MADRLLNTVLQYYQDVHDAARTEQIIGTTAHLLAQLSNPLNLGILTSQLLTARAIWHNPDGLRTSIRIISIYNTAASRVREQEKEKNAGIGLRGGGGLHCEDWVRAVVKGADDRSRRWQHLLVLTGALMGMENDDRRSLTAAMRNTLENAIVTAANLALETHVQDGHLAAASTVMALNFAFPLLSEFNRSQVNCNALLPIIVRTITTDEGFRDGQFLEAIARDISGTLDTVLNWPANSLSFRALQAMDQRPLMGNMGPLSKLAGFAVSQAQDTGAVLAAQQELLNFTGTLLNLWRSLPFSDVDPALEAAKLSSETAQTTWPALWQLLRKLLFGVVAILQAIVSRSLLDPVMINERTAPAISSKSLHILRNLSFISSHGGNNAFQVYTFTYMASIDVISRHPPACEMYLAETRPQAPVMLPSQHCQRTLDLFFLNLAEHLPLSLSTNACENLVLEPALAYISHDGPMTRTIVELFEAAHSAILSVLSCPQHSPLTVRMAPFYILKLFESFPRHISPRQFRLAFKTVMQIVSPPFPVAAINPDLSETLLELLRHYMANASTEPLPATLDAETGQAGTQQAEDLLSYQSSLALALVDSLPYLPLPIVEDWLAIAAQALNEIEDPGLREPVKRRFLDILVSGEMDVERAAIGVNWWGTRGGRESVILGRTSESLMMSGAIGPERSSHL
ncbi:unnamed protein product [Clonostachys solani]|uniref:Peroxisomal membrane protein PEX17 n=1 Tax=Clonostachys solani TaxID=160281 RepID=A0A9N9Z519_9HYPO|nr:unnamed protein product [Clonostachys solani]